ncbi:hypothetical protein EV652_1034 [Kribbella steppae]|uniref:Uncharacterized protein n=1 Tax=Kribbella steppae TaxID=2512223 RepID=A0A4R2HSQ7_9ACTN|nr:hypothetical protein [Kribbella steppae]TCO33005.1 hypothetical protein EV652_1034 [Kribbella steppae]
MTVLASHVYYFEVGAGVWRGNFTFHVTSWRRLTQSRVGLKHQLLVLAMHVTQRIGGAARLDSTILPQPTEGEFGVAENTVKISKLGFPLYLLRERYLLSGDGVGVTVEAAEQFGPLPRFMTRTFVYQAEIRDGGMASIYFMPLLGDEWTATYHVGSDRKTLKGDLVCDWARAKEVAQRVGGDST